MVLFTTETILFIACVATLFPNNVVSQGYCNTDTDCPGTDTCVSQECIPVCFIYDCCRNNDCPGGQYCRPPGDCVTGTGVCECSTDSDCPGTDACLAACECIPVCLTYDCCRDSDCPRDKDCRPPGDCVAVAECSTDSDCPGTETCVNQKCVPVCQTYECCNDSDCPSGQYCRPPGDCVAVAECSTDSDCPGTETCVNQKCVPVCQTYECCNDSDCPSGQYCRSPGDCVDVGDGGDGDDGGGGGPCFSGANMVDVQGKGRIFMDSLEIGDCIRSSDRTCSKVYSFGHYAPKTKTNYLQIRTGSMEKNHPLEISQEHLIYVHDDSTKKTWVLPAKDLIVGDYLVTETGCSPITWIHTIQRHGAYAPLTATGDIVVNGVLVSNYVVRDWLPSMVPGQMLHLLQHGASLPYRMFCSLVGCKNEMYNELTGFSPWVNFWFGVEQWQLHLNGILRAVFFSFLAVPAVCAVLVGKLPSAPSSIVIQLVAALIGVLVWKKNKEKHQTVKNAV